MRLNINAMLQFRSLYWNRLPRKEKTAQNKETWIISLGLYRRHSF